MKKPCYKKLTKHVTFWFFSLALIHSLEFSGHAKNSEFYIMPFENVSQVFETRLRGAPSVRTQELAKHFYDLCKKFDFDPAFMLGVIDVESSFDGQAISPMGARGLMQLMPQTAYLMAKRAGVMLKGESDIHDPYKNILLGIHYLAHLREKYNGHRAHYLAAYLAGPARVDELIASGQWKMRQTKKYVGLILNRMNEYQALHRTM